jgi:hypothetical protein
VIEHKRFGTLAIAISCAALLTHPARAQDAGPADADRLFKHAVTLMKEDRCSDAIPELLQSQALDPSAATLLNLGTCYARLERKATAFKTYRRAAEQAAKENDEPMRERALQAMSILEPTLTKLQIVSPADAPQLSVRVNGEVVSDYTGLPIPLDPGENLVEAAAPGHEPWRQNITAPNAAATLVVHVPELRLLEPPPAPPLATNPPPPDHKPDLRVPAAAIGGAGIAAIIVGSVFGFSAKSTYDDSAPYCNGNECTAPGITLRDNARDKATIATITVTSGLVATAAGIAMWIISGKGQPEPERQAVVTGWSVPGGGGLAVELQR